MTKEFLLYGATGYVGEAVARRAVAQGLRPIVAGRDAVRVAALADALGVGHRIFALDDAGAMDTALAETALVLNCAGPFRDTAAAMVDGCLRTGTHYLDITGELPVFEATGHRDGEARSLGVMLLPGVGFDVVATDCLALHLKQRLPTAERLTLAFHLDGPSLLPPGTVRTMAGSRPAAATVRVDGELVAAPRGATTRRIDFGNGPVTTRRQSWGDVVTAYWSTGIPNIEAYAAWSRGAWRQLAAAASAQREGTTNEPARPTPLAGPVTENRARSRAHVWGEARDGRGRRVVARLHGPEAGVDWTSDAALSVVRHVLAGDAEAGFQTPASAYGAELVLEPEGVAREDLD